MLSVNIPVYNFEVVTLVKQLLKQANSLAIDVEIRVYDDGSDEIIKSLNGGLKELPQVVYVELSKNVGRVAIRNKMGFEARYENLLFIDADSLLIAENYLKNYIRELKSGRILCGGTSYSQEKPADKNKLLRWYYGSKREAVSAEKRNSKKGFIITSNNFLIEKKVFQKIHFREDLKEYGHEDTLLGYDLFCAGYEIFHIQNPVEHTGLESAHLFLQKTKAALKNLKLVCDDLIEDDKTFRKQLSFLNIYSKLSGALPNRLLPWCFNKYEKHMENNLKGERPNLRCFDFYKLSYYASIKNR